MTRRSRCSADWAAAARGAAHAGAIVAGGVDAWPLATEVFADNFPAASVFTSSVEDLDPLRILDATGPIDLLLASPECTKPQLRPRLSSEVRQES